VNLRIIVDGGRTIAQNVFLGMFDFKESGIFLCFWVSNVDGTMVTYDYGGNVVQLMEWLEANPPTDIDYLSPVNQHEARPSGQGETVEVVVQDPFDEQDPFDAQDTSDTEYSSDVEHSSDEVYPYQTQLSQGCNHSAITVDK